MNPDIGAIFASDTTFDELYPVAVRHLSEVHWTPLEVAKVAAEFLVNGNNNAHILDIGAGTGKFCLAGSYYTGGHFTGIEQKKNLVRAGNKVILQLSLTNAALLHANFADCTLKGYTGIYIYNSFFEQIVSSCEPEDEIRTTPELYEHYQQHLQSELKNMPAGTRLATYWLNAGEIPGAYCLKDTAFDGLLKMWIKA